MQQIMLIHCISCPQIHYRPFCRQIAIFFEKVQHLKTLSLGITELSNDMRGCHSQLSIRTGECTARIGTAVFPN